MFKIIAESGATKTEWRAVDINGSVRALRTEGLNPNTMDMETIQGIFRKVIPALNPEGKLVEEVHFYGAGLVSEESSAPLRAALELWCPLAQINFYTDLLAAARALFGNGSGVAAIMGTGSNSCLYENGVISANIRPGGYILGDEGSGMALGKALLADFIKGLLPKTIEEEFKKEYGLDYAKIVQKVYREPAASAFMASFAPFVLERIEVPYMRMITENCLEDFIQRSLMRYKSHTSQPLKIGIVGSFGCACRPILEELGAKYSLEFVKFIKSPIDELAEYHRISIT